MDPTSYALAGPTTPTNALPIISLGEPGPPKRLTKIVLPWTCQMSLHIGNVGATFPIQVRGLLGSQVAFVYTTSVSPVFNPFSNQASSTQPEWIISDTVIQDLNMPIFPGDRLAIEFILNTSSYGACSAILGFCITPDVNGFSSTGSFLIQYQPLVGYVQTEN